MCKCEKEDKPPIGVIPPKFSIHYQNRYDELIGAVRQYEEKGREVPQHWIKELCMIAEIQNISIRYYKP